MKISRRSAITGAASIGAMAALGRSRLQAAEGAEVGDNGLFTQDWFLETFFDLADDHAELAAQDKNLAILFEQRGCPYCRELHRVNFGRKEILSYLEKHYGVLQFDLWGSRAVTDFDGEQLEERALAQKGRVIFTPTMIFFPRDKEGVKGKSIADAEAFRMPGYFKPFHFMSTLEYVNEGHYRTTNFQRYLQAKFKKLKEQGKDPDVW
ncbi:MAG: thioredoxin family protein [Hyphomicrobiaceae bacterium]|nr:thioredoxin family protein [Hyphomicrobiaceae bacterium]